MSLKVRLATPFRVSLPILLRFLADAALLIPAHAVLGFVVLWGAAQLLTGWWADAGVVATLGGWSITALYALAGAVGGAAAGAAAACSRTLEYVEGHTETWLLGLPAEPGRELLPSMPLGELEARYEETLDRVVEATVGRLPMPGLVRRLARDRLGQALLDDFIEGCRERGVEVVGHGELRNWLLGRGLAYALEPARAQLRLWRSVALAGLGTVVLVTLAIALLGGALEPVAIVLTVCGLAGVGILAAGLPRASLRERPERWRAGIVVLGLCAAGWPPVYAWLWPRDLGLVGWIVVLALTLVTVRRGFEEAFVRGGAVVGPEAPPEGPGHLARSRPRR